MKTITVHEMNEKIISLEKKLNNYTAKLQEEFQNKLRKKFKIKDLKCYFCKQGYDDGSPIIYAIIITSKINDFEFNVMENRLECCYVKRNINRNEEIYNYVKKIMFNE